jgi:hypothetical protein
MATLYSAQWHRAQAYLRQFPGPKAQRAAELAELVARLIEKRLRNSDHDPGSRSADWHACLHSPTAGRRQRCHAVERNVVGW